MFYAQSTGAVISGRWQRETETERELCMQSCYTSNSVPCIIPWNVAVANTISKQTTMFLAVPELVCMHAFQRCTWLSCCVSVAWQRCWPLGSSTSTTPHRKSPWANTIASSQLRCSSLSPISSIATRKNRNIHTETSLAVPITWPRSRLCRQVPSLRCHVNYPSSTASWVTSK